jgi:Dirigent-like protein
MALTMGALAPLGVASAHEVSNRPQSTASGEVLRVFEHAIAVKFITVSTPNDPRGNYVVFFDPVFNTTDTHQIGRNSGTCVTTSKTVQECQITFIFPGGEIAVQGPELLSGAASTMVIVGGTGRYSGKKGSVTSSQIKKSTGLEYEFVFHFR